MHDFLVVAAVVVHHRKQRNLVPRRRPQHAGRVHEVAIRLEADRDAAEVAVGERRADGGGRRIADAVAPRAP